VGIEAPGVERGRGGDEALVGAELGQRRPVAGDLDGGGEARVPGVRDVARPDEAGVVGDDDREGG